MSKGLLFAQTKSEAPCLKAVKQAFSDAKAESVAVKESVSVNEATLLVEGGWSGLVVLTVSDKEELVASIDFMNAHATKITKDKTVRVVVFNKLPGKRIESHFTNLGSAKILDFRVTGKSVVHKLQRHLKIVMNASSGEENDAGNSSGGRNRNSNKDSSDPTIELVAPLTHSADFWLVRSPPDAKRSASRWNIELVGPSPGAGQWIPSGSSSYEWQSRDPEGPFNSKFGKWIFHGRMVQFFQHSKRWRFTGDKISLVFYEADKVVAQRFVAETSTVIKIANNSNSAKEKMPEIEKSFEDKDWGTIEGKTSDDPADDKDFRYQEETRTSKDLALEASDEEPKEWNEHMDSAENADAGLNDSVGEDAQDANWNDSPGLGGPALAFENSMQRMSARPGEKNIFNSDQSTSEARDKAAKGLIEEEFSTSEEAFKPIRVNATINGKEADILEVDDLRITLRIDPIEVQSGVEVLFKAETMNMRPQGSVATRGEIISSDPEPDGKGLKITIEIEEKSRPDWQLVLAGVESRQMNILRFFKMAKGT